MYRNKTIVFTCILCFLCVSFRNNDGLLHDSIRSRDFRLSIIHHTKSGSTTRSYTISGRKLRIYEKPFPDTGYMDHLFTEHGFNAKAFFDRLNQLNLDNLDSSYANRCIPPDSGVDYILSYTTGAKTTKITIHSYYLERMRQVTDLLNSYLSSIYRIEYLPKETKQDCN